MAAASLDSSSPPSPVREIMVPLSTVLRLVRDKITVAASGPTNAMTLLGGLIRELQDLGRQAREGE